MRLFYCFVFLLSMLTHTARAQEQDPEVVNNVLMISEPDLLPPGAVEVDKKIKIIDQGTGKYCTYDKTVYEAKRRVVKAAGNLLLITNMGYPEAKAGCYTLKGKAYAISDAEGMRATLAARQDSLQRSILPPEGAQYALLYVLRPMITTGMAISYNLHAGEDQLCRVHFNSFQVVKLYREGPTTLWARTEARDEVPLDIRFGQAYFLKCSVETGIAVGRPTLAIVSTDYGLRRFRFDKVSLDQRQ